VPGSADPRGVWSRLRAWARPFLPGLPPAGRARASGEGAPGARWPHLVRGWLDPGVPLSGWRTRIAGQDLHEALGAIAAASDGRVAPAAVAELLDAIAHTAPGDACAFRFGDPRAFLQVWIGLQPEAGGAVKVFLLADGRLTARVEEALTVARFASPAARAEYDLLHRFFVAAWEWRFSASPWAGARNGGDAQRVAARMARILSDPQAPLLEALRGLRARTRELLDETAELDAAGVAAADAWLAARDAPTLSEMRRRIGAASQR